MATRTATALCGSTAPADGSNASRDESDKDYAVDLDTVAFYYDIVDGKAVYGVATGWDDMSNVEGRHQGPGLPRSGEDHRPHLCGHQPGRPGALQHPRGYRL